MNMEGTITVTAGEVDHKLQWSVDFDEKYKVIDNIEVYTLYDPNTNLVELLDMDIYKRLCAELSEHCYDRYSELTSPHISREEAEAELKFEIEKDLS